MLTGDDWDNSVFSWNTSLYMFKFSTLTVGLAHIGYGEIRGSWHSFPLSRCRPSLYTAIKQYIDDPWVGFRNMPYSWYALNSEASSDIGAMMLGKCVCVCGGGGGRWSPDVFLLHCTVTSLQLHCKFSLTKCKWLCVSCLLQICLCAVPPRLGLSPWLNEESTLLYCLHKWYLADIWFFFPKVLARVLVVSTPWLSYSVYTIFY